MLALLLLLTATAVGLAAAAPLKLAFGPWTRVGLGLACGQLLLLWVPLLVAAAFDLGVRAAGLAATALLSVAGLAAAFSLRRAGYRARGGVAQLGAGLAAARNRPIVLVGGAALILLAWLHHTHYLVPRADGLHSAGVTWGDLPMHLGLVARFLHAEGFGPLEHPLYLNGPLTYPFVPDYAVAVLTALGLPLRWAFILGGLLPLIALVLLVHGLTRLWIASPGPLVSSLALILFLLAGGLGFAHIALRLLEGTPPLELLAGTNATYIAPHILKSGHVGNLFIAARTASYGMCIGIAVLILLGHMLEADRPARGPLVLAGLLAGSLPLVHSHSFLVLCGVVLWYVLLGRRWGTRWGFCVVPLGLAALPQVAWLLHRGGPSLVRIAPGFLRPAPSASEWLIDLSLGLGVWLVLAPLGFRAAGPRARRLAFPLLLLLPLANLVTFTPAVYDNVKLVAWFDVAAAPLIAGLVARLRRPRAEGVVSRGRAILAWLALLACTASGALAVGHELTNDALVVSHEDVRLAARVAEHTAPSAIIATAASHHDPVAMFSGRRPLVASPYMLGTHGIDIRQRARDVVALYSGGDPAREVIARLGVSAVLVGPRERSELPLIDEAFLSRESRTSYAFGEHRLYLLR